MPIMHGCLLVLVCRVNVNVIKILSTKFITFYWLFRCSLLESLFYQPMPRVCEMNCLRHENAREGVMAFHRRHFKK